MKSPNQDRYEKLFFDLPVCLCLLIKIERERQPIFKLPVRSQYIYINKNISFHNLSGEIHWRASIILQGFFVSIRVQPYHQALFLYTYAHLMIYHKAQSAEHFFLLDI